MASFMVMHDSVPCQAVATCLAIPELHVALDLDLGGQAPCYLVWLAANLVEAGAADAIVVFRAMNGRSADAGRHHAVRRDGRPVPLPHRLRRLPHVRGHVGPAVPLRDRPGGGRPGRWSCSASASTRSATSGRSGGGPSTSTSTWRAHGRRPLPGRRLHRRGRRRLRRRRGHSLDRARDLRQPPVGRSRRAPTGPGRVPGSTSATTCCGTTTPATTPRTWLPATVRPAPASSAGDVAVGRDLRLLHQHRAHRARGLGPGRAGRVGGLRPEWPHPAWTGRLPTNTHGGLLSEGYLHGMNTVAEAVLQIQGRGGTRQAPDHEVASSPRAP